MTKSNSILITPEATLVAGKAMQPDNISIVLDTGTAYDLDTVIAMLEKHDRKKIKKPSIFAKTKRGFTAFRAAMKETENTPS